MDNEKIKWTLQHLRIQIRKALSKVLQQIKKLQLKQETPTEIEKWWTGGLEKGLKENEIVS